MSKISHIAALADSIVKKYGTRNPYEIADSLGITILRCPFSKQKGVYKIIKRNRFIFLNDSLDEEMEKIVLLHEIGHDRLHRYEATQKGSFQEFSIFNMGKDRLEYEANIFAAQILLPDDEVLDYIKLGYDISQIASEMNSDINLVALKIDTLIARGYTLRKQDHKSNFLKY